MIFGLREIWVFCQRSIDNIDCCNAYNSSFNFSTYGLSKLMSLNSFDIIVITEPWLNSEVTDKYVSQSGYKTFRRDRTMVFVEICDMNDPEIESQWFLIKTDVSGPTFFKCLDHLLTVYPISGILVLGDFNQFRPGNLCGSFKLKKIVKTPTRGKTSLTKFTPICHSIIIIYHLTFY